MFDNIKALKGAQIINRGGVARLSQSQIVTLIINLPDAKRNLSPDDFRRVFSIFSTFRKQKEKQLMDLESYSETCFLMIDEFETIAPFEFYNGNESNLIRKESDEKKAKRRSLREQENILSEMKRQYNEANESLKVTSIEDIESAYKTGYISQDKYQEFKNATELLQATVAMYPRIIIDTELNCEKIREELKSMR